MSGRVTDRPNTLQRYPRCPALAALHRLVGMITGNVESWLPRLGCLLAEALLDQLVVGDIPAADLGGLCKTLLEEV